MGRNSAQPSGCKVARIYAIHHELSFVMFVSVVSRVLSFTAGRRLRIAPLSSGFRVARFENAVLTSVSLETRNSNLKPCLNHNSRMRSPCERNRFREFLVGFIYEIL